MFYRAVIVLLLLPALAAASGHSENASGIIKVKSAYTVTETMDRFKQELNTKGMTLFQHISHSKNASDIGIQLKTKELLIFGKPQVGSKLMQCSQSIALDLPQKALIWVDSDDSVWISYNDMSYLSQRHGLEACEKLVGKVSAVLHGIAHQAAGSAP